MLLLNHRQCRIPLLLLVLPLAACSTSENQSRYALPKVPAYATPIDGQHWSVSCSRGRVSVPRESLNEFFDANGNEKSYQAFCDDSQTNRIRSKR